MRAQVVDLPEATREAGARGLAGGAERKQRVRIDSLETFARTPHQRDLALLLADGLAAGQETIVDPDVGLHVRPNLR